MGCVPSSAKVAHEDVDDMADSLPEPAPPAPTDPRLPLTARQVFKLKKSWKGIKRNMELTGVEMFIRWEQFERKYDVRDETNVVVVVATVGKGARETVDTRVHSHCCCLERW